MANGSIRRSSMTMALCGLMAALALVPPLLGSVFPPGCVRLSPFIAS